MLSVEVTIAIGRPATTDGPPKGFEASFAAVHFFREVQPERRSLAD
jgi:hypothetical protein